MTLIPLFNSTFLGEYRTRYPSGETITYEANSIVLYEGKLFISTARILSGSPDTNNNWSPLGNSRVSYRDTQPPDPRIGDTWFNSTTGKLYTFIDDGETKQFVEL
jgi:hypothetical protein|tara:strand:- start:168 stop:482 length:315 start_codon:yes stop_codon:yes gene_type:complete